MLFAAHLASLLMGHSWQAREAFRLDRFVAVRRSWKPGEQRTCSATAFSSSGPDSCIAFVVEDQSVTGYINSESALSAQLPSTSTKCQQCREHATQMQNVQPAEAMRSARTRWIAAATLLQRAFRRWRERRALAARLAAIRCGVAAVRVLQAAWRGRPLRAAFLRLRAAAVSVQVSTSGRLLSWFISLSK